MDHHMVSTNYRDGLWQWECTCGAASADWTSRGNAIDGWREHRDDARAAAVDALRS